MNGGFDNKKILFTGKFIVLLVVIVLSSQIIQYELIEYYNLEDTQSPETISVRPLRRTPWYQVLPKGSVIYSAKEEVAKKRDELAHEKSDFLFVDLDVMTVDQYRAGEIVATYDVKAKGAEGSFSETPNGFYRIQGKERNHFSKIHKVWMPWSMHFFGNYFIHGWPYLPDGTPIRGTTSGGCIRLLTGAAAALYQSVGVGTPVLVSTSKNASSPEFSYFKKLPTKHEVTSSFEIGSAGALVADIETGEILAGKNKDKIFSIGPLSKLMTALVASEAIRDDAKAIVSRELTERYGKETQFYAGEVFLAENLLEPLLLSSSDIAASLLAKAMWNFVGSMNEKAQSIGLADTHYTDPAGVGEENTSTAEDLFRLLRFMYAHKRPLFDITAQKTYILRPYGGGVPEELKNLTWTPDDAKFVGGISGDFSDGSQGFAAIFDVPFSEYGNRRIGIILIGSKNRAKDVLTATNYLQNQYVYGSVLTTRWKILPPNRDGNSLYHVIGGPGQ